MSMIRYRAEDVPPITPQRQAEIEALAANATDSDDPPLLPAELWANAEIGKFYKPRKEHTSIRLDADVLAWLRSTGAGWQNRVNATLRGMMRQALSGGRQLPDTQHTSAA
jgi:uncharacterized protein (DUF4415 family)